MKSLGIARLLTLFLCAQTLLLAKAEAALVCDRQKIQQSLRAAKSSQLIAEYARRPQMKPAIPASKRLNNLFRSLEKKTFGRRVLQFEGFPAWPGLTRSGNLIQFSSITDESLRKNLKNPDLGAVFEMAHEMGHIVQEISIAANETLKSPHGLKNVTSQSDPQGYNLLHSETDCIAIEILYQAGYPLTDDILKTLSLIKEECQAEQPGEFCESADRLRKTATQAYINLILNESTTKTGSRPQKSP